MRFSNILLAVSSLFVVLSAQADTIIDKLVFQDWQFAGRLPIFSYTETFYNNENIRENFHPNGNFAVAPERHPTSPEFPQSVIEPNRAPVNSVTVVGNTIQYAFKNPTLWVSSEAQIVDYVYMFEVYGYNKNYFSASFEAYSPLVLVAELGSNEGQMSGYLRVAQTSYFPNSSNPSPGKTQLAAADGALVYFELNYRLASNGANTYDVFTEDFFDYKQGEYGFWDTKIGFVHVSGHIDFTKVLTAVPEPSSYAMLGLGLGILGFAARRRKSA